MTKSGPQDAQECLDVQIEPNEGAKQVTYTCKLCQCTASIEGAFQKSRSRKSQPASYTCVTCIAYRTGNGPSRRFTHGWFDVIFFVFVLGIIAYNIGITPIAHTVTWLLKWLLLLYVAMFVHELGHFIMTRIMGYKVRLMLLGSGPVLKVFRLGRFFLVVKLLPFAGLIHPEITLAKNVRKKFACIVLAGPLINLTVAVGAAYLLYYSSLTLSPTTTEVMWSWLVANAYFGITNLIPFRIAEKSNFFRSDGQHLVDLPSWTDDDIKKLIRANQSLFVQMEFQYGDKNIARAIAIEAIESGMEAQALSSIVAVTSSTHDELAYSLKLHRKVLKTVHQEDELSALARNNFAYNIIQLGDDSLFSEANEQSLKAIGTLPMSLDIRSTRGSVLIAMGRYVEGLALLEDERFAIDTNENQARVSYDRAKAYDALGRAADAAESRDKATALMESANRVKT